MTLRPWTLGLLTLACACGADDGQTDVSIRLALSRSEGPAPSTSDAQGTAFTFQSARAYLRHIELDLPDGKRCSDLAAEDSSPNVQCDSSSDKLRIPGPFVVDLMSGATTPSLEGVVIPAGRYKRVDIRFDDAKAEDAILPAGDPLEDNTLLASGSFEHGGTGAAFEVVLKFNEDARFESEEGVEVGSEAGALLLELDVSRWFSTLPVTQCLDDGDLEVLDGLLQIRDEGGSCSDVENALKAAIKTSGQLDRG